MRHIENWIVTDLYVSTFHTASRGVRRHFVDIFIQSTLPSRNWKLMWLGEYPNHSTADLAATLSDDGSPYALMTSARLEPMPIPSFVRPVDGGTSVTSPVPGQMKSPTLENSNPVASVCDGCPSAAITSWTVM